MTPPADPTPVDVRALATEAVRLAEAAAPGPWRGSMTGHSIKAARDFDEVLFAVPCDGRLSAERWREWLANVDLACHAGTHYATLARALLAALDEREAMVRGGLAANEVLDEVTADRDALLADLPHAVGRCGCPPAKGARTLWPEAHKAAIARLEGRGK